MCIRDRLLHRQAKALQRKGDAARINPRLLVWPALQGAQEHVAVPRGEMCIRDRASCCSAKARAMAMKWPSAGEMNFDLCTARHTVLCTERPCTRILASIRVQGLSVHSTVCLAVHKSKFISPALGHFMAMARALALQQDALSLIHISPRGTATCSCAP